MVYPGAAGAETFAIMATGATAPFFWGEVLIGIVVPFAILVFAKNRARMGLVAAASVCVVLGVLCKRVWLLLTSFVVPNVMGAPGIISGSSAAATATGFDVWAVTSSYAPTPIELVIVVGVISLGALAFMVLMSKFTAVNAASTKAAPQMAAADIA